MRLLARHLPAVLAFPVGLLVLTFAVILLVYVVESPLHISLLMAVVPPASMALMAAAIGLTFYGRGDVRGQAEWSVLAPVMAGGAVLTMYWNNIIGNFLGGLRDVFTSPGTIEGAAVSVALLVALCVGCAAAATFWMERAPAAGRTHGVWHDLGAVAVLTMFTLWPRTVSANVADALGWGVGPTLEAAFEGAHLRSAAHSAFALVGILAPCLLIALVGWRRADAISRWRGLAMLGLWVAVNHWMAYFHRLTPRVAYDDWGQAAVFGAVAGVPAILYARLVVTPLWRRAQPRLDKPSLGTLP